jgi:hypothetical protein
MLYTATSKKVTGVHIYVRASILSALQSLSIYYKNQQYKVRGTLPNATSGAYWVTKTARLQRSVDLILVHKSQSIVPCKGEMQTIFQMCDHKFKMLSICEQIMGQLKLTHQKLTYYSNCYVHTRTCPVCTIAHIQYT